MRFLALDVGDKRTGIALGDDESNVSAPVGVEQTPIKPQDHWLDAIACLVTKNAPDALVVGLPLNMDGSDGEPARRARALAKALADRVNLPVHLQDERLTTEQARWAMAGSGMTHRRKKQLKDALAAAIILQDFLSGLE